MACQEDVGRRHEAFAKLVPQTTLFSAKAAVWQSVYALMSCQEEARGREAASVGIVSAPRSTRFVNVHFWGPSKLCFFYISLHARVMSGRCWKKTWPAGLDAFTRWRPGQASKDRFGHIFAC